MPQFSQETRERFHYTILTAYNNKGLYFLRLFLGVNFLDLIRAASFAPSFQTRLVFMVKP